MLALVEVAAEECSVRASQLTGEKAAEQELMFERYLRHQILDQPKQLRSVSEVQEVPAQVEVHSLPVTAEQAEETVHLVAQS